MPRRKRQLFTLKLALGVVVVVFFGGVAFELGRYVARMDTDLGLIGDDGADETEIEVTDE